MVTHTETKGCSLGSKPFTQSFSPNVEMRMIMSSSVVDSVGLILALTNREGDRSAGKSRGSGRLFLIATLVL